MASDLLLLSVLKGVMGSRGKKSRNAQRYLAGRASGLSGASTLLTAAGLAWGVMETLEGSGRSGGRTGQDPVSPVSSPVPSASTDVTPAPPGHDTAALSDAGDLRLVRLAISAAGADGALSDTERAAILQQAQSRGLGDVAERELHAPRPLPEIVRGVTDRAEAATLYVMAFTILRADEQLTGPERIYLARLAQLLDLDPATVQTLEVETGARIDALGDQGQPGG